MSEPTVLTRIHDKGHDEVTTLQPGDKYFWITTNTDDAKHCVIHDIMLDRDECAVLRDAMNRYLEE